MITFTIRVYITAFLCILQSGFQGLGLAFPSPSWHGHGQGFHISYLLAYPYIITRLISIYSLQKYFSNIQLKLIYEGSALITCFTVDREYYNALKTHGINYIIYSSNKETIKWMQKIGMDQVVHLRSGIIFLLL